MLKLTRKQELQLIDLGLEVLINRMIPVKVKKVKEPKPKEKKMSAAARKAIGQRMKAYWAKKRQTKEK